MLFRANLLALFIKQKRQKTVLIEHLKLLLMCFDDGRIEIPQTADEEYRFPSLTLTEHPPSAEKMRLLPGLAEIAAV
jgi:hypothetical protein